MVLSCFSMETQKPGCGRALIVTGLVSRPPLRTASITTPVPRPGRGSAAPPSEPGFPRRRTPPVDTHEWAASGGTLLPSQHWRGASGAAGFSADPLLSLPRDWAEAVDGFPPRDRRVRRDP